MRKLAYSVLCLSLLASCSKDWTTTESKREEFEKLALEDLKEKRDNFKWVAEAERVKENAEALEAYWAELREYKRRSWLNTGEAGGQKPIFYFWYSGDTWGAVKGVAKSWLQALPDSLTAISMWGSIGAKYPSEKTENMKKDLEIFHKKGSVVLMCWQTSGPGLGIPGNKERTINGWEYFRQKYPYEEVEATDHQWGAIYARELARYIIAWDFDGYDIDWETCGDHGTVTPQGHSFIVSEGDYRNLRLFVEEISKYFGPKYSGAERERYLEQLFDPNTEGFHPNEKEFIDAFKPYLPENYKTKRYYLCADIPCGIPNPVKNTFTQNFDKHFLQDYTVSGVGLTRNMNAFGGPLYNSTSANFQANGYGVVIAKAEKIKQRSIWGFGVYHGQTDFANSKDHSMFKEYMNRNHLKRSYANYAWTREVIRISDPRPSYSDYKELDPIIITP